MALVCSGGYIRSLRGCGCDPTNSSMIILKKSIQENLNIALTLKPITDVYLINHQDCGAIRAFLSCSNYPDFGENNPKEIKIKFNAINVIKTYRLN